MLGWVQQFILSHSWVAHTKLTNPPVRRLPPTYLIASVELFYICMCIFRYKSIPGSLGKMGDRNIFFEVLEHICKRCFELIFLDVISLVFLGNITTEGVLTFGENTRSWFFVSLLAFAMGLGCLEPVCWLVSGPKETPLPQTPKGSLCTQKWAQPGLKEDFRELGKSSIPQELVTPVLIY